MLGEGSLMPTPFAGICSIENHNNARHSLFFGLEYDYGYSGKQDNIFINDLRLAINYQFNSTIGIGFSLPFTKKFFSKARPTRWYTIWWGALGGTFRDHAAGPHYQRLRWTSRRKWYRETKRYIACCLCWKETHERDIERMHREESDRACRDHRLSRLRRSYGTSVEFRL